MDSDAAVSRANRDGAAVANFIERNGARLLAVARRYSRTASDAEDAYQRACELLLTKGPLDVDGWLPWMYTVVKNEALRGVRDRRREVDAEDATFASIADVHQSAPDDAVLEREEAAQGREILSRLKPDHIRCLLLRAEGMRYEQIAALTGFSYTRVNRYLSDGRRAIAEQLHRAESGAACRRLVAQLSSYADGEVDAATATRVRLHLDGCGGCRSTLIAYREAPRRIAVLFPVGSSFVPGEATGQIGDATGTFWTALQERISSVPGVSSAASDAAAAKKVAAVAAVATAIAAGGAGVVQVTGDDRAGEPPPLLSPPAAAPQSRADSDATELRDRRRSGRGDGEREAGGEREATAADVINPDREAAGARPPAGAPDPVAATEPEAAAGGDVPLAIEPPVEDGGDSPATNGLEAVAP